MLLENQQPHACHARSLMYENQRSARKQQQHRNVANRISILPQFEPPTNIMTIFSSAFPAFKAYAERVAEGFGYAVYFVPKASPIRTERTSTQPAVPLSHCNTLQESSPILPCPSFQPAVGDSGYDRISVEVNAGSTLHQHAQLKLSVHHNETGRSYLAGGLLVELEPCDTDMEIRGIDVNGSNAYVTVAIDGNGSIKIEPEVELPEDDCLFVGTALTSPVNHRIPYYTIPAEDIPDGGNVAPTTFAGYAP